MHIIPEGNLSAMLVEKGVFGKLTVSRQICGYIFQHKCFKNIQHIVFGVLNTNMMIYDAK